MDTYSGAQIVSIRYDLFGSKLTAAMNGLRIARSYDLRFKWHWGDTRPNAKVRRVHTLNNPWDVFDQRFIEKFLILRPLTRDHGLPHLPRFETLEEFRENISNGIKFNVTNRVRPFLFPWERPRDIASQISDSFWSESPLSAGAQRAIGIYEEKKQGISEKIFGIHVRRGDIINNPSTMKGAWGGMYLPDEIVDAAVKEIGRRGCPVQVFCADQRVIEKVRRNNDNVVLHTDFFTPSTSTLLNDFMEIYMMSRCHVLVSSGNSGFSAAGACLGGVKHMHFDKIIGTEKRAEAIDRCFVRLLRGLNNFMNFGDAAQTSNYLLRHFVAEKDWKRFRRVLDFCKLNNIDTERYLKALSRHLATPHARKALVGHGVHPVSPD